MIMCCINSMFLGEAGGNVPVVVGGSVRVGWPGAPGWTTTGPGGGACCALITDVSRTARAPAARSRLRHTFTLPTSHVLLSDQSTASLSSSPRYCTHARRTPAAVEA